MSEQEQAMPRRLSDKIVLAHEQACEQGKPEVARVLLQALELELSAFGGGQATEHRDVDEAVAAAYARQQAAESSA